MKGGGKEEESGKGRQSRPRGITQLEAAVTKLLVSDAAHVVLALHVEHRHLGGTAAPRDGAICNTKLAAPPLLIALTLVVLDEAGPVAVTFLAQLELAAPPLRVTLHVVLRGCVALARAGGQEEEEEEEEK